MEERDVNVAKKAVDEGLNELVVTSVAIQTWQMSQTTLNKRKKIIFFINYIMSRHPTKTT